ncbi:MAG: SDR family NAD(P)-dependent oxidoreductase [Kurthia sp.]|nr:SDR family NAD(P)-dependent oxidoreductase [Candidatus Kurthia equi]
MKQNKVILVTGATSGVGFALTKKLLNASYTVIATGRNQAQLQRMEQLGAMTICGDLTLQEDLDALIEQLPTINVAILNAGIGTFDYVASISDDAIEEMIGLNISSQIKLTKRLIPLVKEQFIFMGSQAGKVATPKAAIYAATKYALIGFTNGLRLEQPTKVVTVIHPGPIDSPFLDHADATNTYREKMGNMLLTAEKVADKTIAAIGTKKREVNIPWYMGISSKLYALAPSMVETVGKPFFNKK